MKPLRPLPVLLAFALAAPAAEPDKEGFVPLFNGKDLSGWVNVNTAPGTFFVKGDEVVTTGKPTGYLRTARQYENFVLELDWMHVNTKEVGNSGVFVWGDPLPAVGSPYTRGIEVQVLVNLEYRDKKTGAVTASSHGDLFSIQGAHCKPDRPHPLGWERCLPSENRAKGGGEWNHYKVVANDGAIKLSVNGKEVSGISQCVPRKGYLALESEGAECHFKNLKIKELPSTNPKPEEVAKLDEGFKSLFNGLDLTGWRVTKGRWDAKGGSLVAAKESWLVSRDEFGPCELMFDWRQPKEATSGVMVNVGGVTALFTLKGLVATASGREWKGGTIETAKEFAKPGAWNRSVVRFDGKEMTIRFNGQEQQTLKPTGEQPALPVRFSTNDAPVEIRNVFIRKLKEK